MYVNILRLVMNKTVYKLTLYTVPKAPDPISVPRRSSDSLISRSVDKSGLASVGVTIFRKQLQNFHKIRQENIQYKKRKHVRYKTQLNIIFCHACICARMQRSKETYSAK